MNFGEAWKIVISGRSVTRLEFDMFYLKMQIPDVNSKMGLPYLYGCVSIDKDGVPTLVPYALTNEDLFSEDWKEF